MLTLDRICYTYDFGDNWEHDIVLQKRLDPIPADNPMLLRRKGPMPTRGLRWPPNASAQPGEEQGPTATAPETWFCQPPRI